MNPTNRQSLSARTVDQHKESDPDADQEATATTL